MSDKELPEAGGVAFCDMYTESGMRIGLTARGHNPQSALDALIECVGNAVTQHGLHTSMPTLDVKHPGPQQQPLVKDDYPLPDEEPQAGSLFVTEFEDTFQPLPQQVGYTDHGFVNRKPKDAGLSDRYELEVSEYRVNKDTKQIEFYAGGQYPEIKHNLGNDVGMNLFLELFKGWKPTEDGQRHAFANGPVILAIQCSDKPNSHGNPWHNLSGVRKA